MSDITDNTVDFLLEMLKLKFRPRRGFFYKAVPLDTIILREESIADHQYFMAFLSIILAPEYLDKTKLMYMALIHDLAEVRTGDFIPSDKIPKKKKHELEYNAMKELCQDKSGLHLKEVFKLWNEYEERTCDESKYVKKLDSLDLCLTSYTLLEKKRIPKDRVAEFFNSAVQNSGLGYGKEPVDQVFNLLRARMDK